MNEKGRYKRRLDYNTHAHAHAVPLSLSLSLSLCPLDRQSPHEPRDTPVGPGKGPEEEHGLEGDVRGEERGTGPGGLGPAHGLRKEAVDRVERDVVPELEQLGEGGRGRGASEGRQDHQGGLGPGEPVHEGPRGEEVEGGQGHPVHLRPSQVVLPHVERVVPVVRQRVRVDQRVPADHEAERRQERRRDQEDPRLARPRQGSHEGRAGVEVDQEVSPRNCSAAVQELREVELRLVGVPVPHDDPAVLRDEGREGRHQRDRDPVVPRQPRPVHPGPPKDAPQVPRQPEQSARPPLRIHLAVEVVRQDECRPHHVRLPEEDRPHRGDPARSVPAPEGQEEGQEHQGEGPRVRVIQVRGEEVHREQVDRQGVQEGVLGRYPGMNLSQDLKGQQCA
mmetsp:Transcript_17436/g.35591  ORF Transcript_17436/g.35591 Transcript_17436/m.35591 type:complete len:392 (-) Transcript_17436:305-1480(-)